MLKRHITYNDFNGKIREEDHYFNMSQAELAELELIYPQGFGKHLNDVVESGNGRLIVDTIKGIIKDSYGIRTEDGRSFVKTEEAFQLFAGSEAYSILFMSLITDPDQASAFVNGIVPAEMAAAVKEKQAQDGFRPGADVLPQSRREQLAREQAQNAQSANQSTEADPLENLTSKPFRVAPSGNDQGGPVKEEPKPVFLENRPENGYATTVVQEPVPSGLTSETLAQAQSEGLQRGDSFTYDEPQNTDSIQQSQAGQAEELNRARALEQERRAGFAAPYDR